LQLLTWPPVRLVVAPAGELDLSATGGVAMTLMAFWYYHSPEGRRFLEGRDIRMMMLVAAGLVAAFTLLRTRARFSPEESRWRTVARMFTGATLATAVWLGVDWIRGEDWIFQLLAALPELHENGIRYSLLIMAGWLGWSIAIFEVLRRMAIRRYSRQAERLPGLRSQ
jgi:glucose-6-phosphate-specific signal transduction histidine kinase